MPAVITHYLMGQACSKQMNDPAVNQRRHAFNMGTQGPDFLYFDILDRKLGQQADAMHMLGIRDFYGACVDYILSREASDEKETLISYMIGFLCHYALDFTAHPYIYYATGFSDETGRLSGVCSRRHRFLETTIDCLLAKNLGNRSAYKMDISRAIDLPAEERQWISRMLSDTIEAGYSFQRGAADYDRSMRAMVLAYRLFHDKSGRRKAVINSLGRLFGDQGATAALIHYEPVNESIDYLNLNRETWRYPWDDSIELSFSFMDLYEKAIEESLICASAFLKAVRQKMAPAVALRILGNKNFSTGLESSVKFLYYNREFMKEKKKGQSHA